VKDFFYKNLEAIKSSSPVLYAKLKNIKENKKYEVFVGSDPVDINILDTQNKTPLYDEPVRQSIEKLKEFDKFSRYPFLCFYGIGNGIFYKAMLKNQAFLHLIVFEPEIELIYIALNFSDFSDDIKKMRFIIFHSSDFTEAVANQLTNLSSIGLYGRLYNLHLLTPYYAIFEKDIVNVNKIFTKAIIQFASTHGNDAEDSLIGIEHFIQNIPQMLKLPKFREFLKQRSVDVAIIVSTGPSLTKQLPLLKKIQNHVTIISVDASLPILEKHNIKPDIVTSLERIALTSEFFKKTSPSFQKDIIALHSAVQDKEVLDNSYCQKIIVLRPFGYMKYFDKLSSYGYSGIGMSAANMAYEIAVLMGHKAVAFIGQDLAYAPDDSTHADDHTFGKSDEKFRTKLEQNPANISYVTKYGGGGVVKTNVVWIMFMNYFVTNIAETKHRILAINCTEGGARIEGTLEMPFATMVENYVDLSTKKKKITLTPTPQKEADKLLKYSQQTVEKMIKIGEQFKDKTQKLFLETAKICEEIEELEDKEFDKINFTKLYKTISKIDTFKTIFENKEFKTIFWESIRSFIVAQEMEIAKIVTRYVKDEIETKKRDIEFLKAHKAWLYFLAGGIDAQIEIMKRALRSLGFSGNKNNS